MEANTIVDIAVVVLCVVIFGGFMFMGYSIAREDGESKFKSVGLGIITPLMLFKEYMLTPEMWEH